MKISKLFHWLYFFVMALPLMVAPIFAIYSHRHTIDSYSATNNESNNINAYQYIFNGMPNGLDDWSFDGEGNSLTFSNGRLLFETLDSYGSIYNDTEISILTNHYYYFSFDYACADTDINISVGISGADDFFFAEDSPLNNGVFYDVLQYSSSSFSDGTFYFVTYEPEELFYFKNIMLFDLTTIFGSGNEPSADVFHSYLVNDYYDYGDNLISIGYHDVTYNDTDIGSQFIYDMYNCVDKYFNYDKVVNFGDLYGWLNTTFFSGQAPLGFFIFWHLLIYWLLTSLLWLIFDVLIYVPMLVHRWLDKASLS